MKGYAEFGLAGEQKVIDYFLLAYQTFFLDLLTRRVYELTAAAIDFGRLTGVGF